MNKRFSLSHTEAPARESISELSFFNKKVQ